ncbi:LOW QUALITY PROTEIN: uncharacterized protein LOC135482224 [Liolophura sinensis]|uniref:LOW QUALITY PROTEIN: uncharacterized protein LOC135482224 n=1 Tax=Liolophura sinensis TaxID=3198878 RepID=UPI003159860A
MSAAVLSEPPSSVQSGIPLQEKYTIEHKSDLLLQEQVENVRNTQDQLDKLITELQITRSKREVSVIQAKVEELRKQSEYEVLKLQVASKISHELAHTRADLERALAGRGDIPACRKRVAWLEGRMERVMGKQRLSKHVCKQYISSPKKVTSSTDVINRAAPQDFINTRSAVVLSFNDDGSAGNKITQASDSVLSVHADEEDSVIADNSTLHTGDEIDHVEIKSPAKQTVCEPSDGMKEFSEDCERPRLIHSAPAGQIACPKEDDDVGIREHPLIRLQSESESHPGSQIIDDISVSQIDKSSVRESQVSLVPVGGTASDEIKSESDRDEAMKYWQSEHHRFESSEISRALCDADPLSYHQMALAIPGSFLSRSQSDMLALPWRPHRKGSDIQDIHKIALNKLMARLNQMSDKVYNAAMLSVKSKPTKPELKPEASFAQSYDTGSKISSDDRNKADVPSGEKTDVNSSLPKLQLKRLGTSGSGCMVYYPNPIPPPQKLPLTRTNHELEFPRLSSYYCDVTDDKRKPAQRIVDQHNLYEETKFSLYRESSRGSLGGPSATEKRLRKLLESDGTCTVTASARTWDLKIRHFLVPNLSHQWNSLSCEGTHYKKKRRKIKSHFAVAKAVAKLKGPNKWTLLKPKGSGMDHSGMKWERVKTLVHINLVSERVEERIDAAKHLGLLKCSDAMVFFALKERIHKDEEKRVQYEAAKSLVLIGCWDDDVMEVILQFLVIGNSDIRSDLINTMAEGKNLQYVDKSTVSFPELVKVLSHFCRNPDPDEIAFDAAILLGKMCVADKYAKARLKSALHQDYDTHHKAKAIEILIKQMNCTDWEVVEEVLELLRVSPVWKYRDLAAKLLILLGIHSVCKDEKVEKVYDLLERKLWDEPITEVRLSVAKTITALNMFPKASERVEQRLEDTDENIRAQAVISLGTLGMKSEKIIRQLLEMIELDSSEYVRIMIVRTFNTLNWNDKRIIRVLREKERSEGVLAMEARKALSVLLGTTGKSKTTRNL